MSENTPAHPERQLGPRLGAIPAPGFRAQALAIVLTLAVTVVGYLGWLGWHATKHVVPGTTSFEGPYESWQVIGLALSLGCLAAVGGWRRLVQSTALTAAVTVTLMFSLDASSQRSEDANLWPVGAFFLLVAASAGLLLVALCFRAAARHAKTSPA